MSLNTDTYYQQGIAYFKQQNYDAAIKEFKKAMSLKNEEDPEDYQWLGLAFLCKKDYDIAIDNFNKAVSLRDDAWNSYWRGMAYISKKDYDAAIEDLTKALLLKDKDNTVDYQLLGAAHIGKENYYAAIDNLIRTLEIDPTFKEAEKLRSLIDTCNKELNEQKENSK